METSMILAFTNGCWDMFHAGHLKLLYEAKKLCDELHVGINSDESIKKYLGKGANRPIVPQEHRLAIVSAIKYVDYAYIFDELTPLRLIEKIKPDIIVKGGDYQNKDVVGSDFAKVVIIPLLDGVSTSKIIEKIVYEECL